jgi:serine/threonine protein phosphatase PrpC
MKINSFSIGSTPNHNEDSIAHANMGINGYAVVMADGMGGLPHGEVASQIACTTIISHIQATYKDFHSELIILKEALEKADDKLISKGLNKYKCQMGTTIAAAIVTDYEIFYTWQGNVRIYHKQESTLRQLTTDHVLDIGYGQQRITRCLKGAGIRDDIPLASERLSRGDSLFFCTDGFYKEHENLLIKDDVFISIKCSITNPKDDTSLIEIDL